MATFVTVWMLYVTACQAPEYQKCIFVATHELTSGLQCQFNRPVADSYYQRNFDPVEMVTFSRCRAERQILIDNRPEIPGKRGQLKPTGLRGR